jgi:hypothetical protein
MSTPSNNAADEAGASDGASPLISVLGDPGVVEGGKEHTMTQELVPQDTERFDESLGLTDKAAYIGPNRGEILYDRITSVGAIKLSYDFTIYHRTASFLPPRSSRVIFRGRSTRDAALARLARQLGFQRREFKYGVARTALRPWFIGCLGAIFTYVSIQAAALVAVGDEVYFYRSNDPYARTVQRLVPLFKMLGPTGVAIVGCLFVLACVVWSVERVRHRPIMITLSRSR